VLNIRSFNDVILTCVGDEAPLWGEWGVGGGGWKLLHWELWEIRSYSLQIWESPSIGAHVVLRGTWCLGGGTFTGDFERRMKEGSLLGNSNIW